MQSRVTCWIVVLCLMSGGPAYLTAAETKTATPPPALRTTLPQAHAYQQQLRGYMATLAERDFDHGSPGALLTPEGPPDPEAQYRNYLFTQMGPPLVGSKRGPPAINAPPRLFTLTAIETPAGVLRPPVYPEALMSLVRWDFPGNVYHNNRGLKLRAFVAAAINLMMLDDFLDHNPASCRSDFMAYQLVQTGAPYLTFKDILPPDVRIAYATGVLKLAQRIIAWGPKGEEIHHDLIAPVGLWYATQVCQDAALNADVENYSRVLFTDPRFTHPAGYFNERGGCDVGFQGTCNFFTTWAALASQSPTAKAAVERAYRLRAHLILPEPDGKSTGPTHFNTRLSSPATIDQWEWGLTRDFCASLVTDEAAHLLPSPPANVLAKAGASRATEFNRQIAENPVKMGNGSAETPYVYYQNDELGSNPWGWRLWVNYSFPASLNYGHDLYPPGAFAHRKQLEAENSPLLKSPFLRDGTFIRDFSQAFTVTKMETYAAIVHSGPIGDHREHDKLGQFKGPLGLGGGQLSAFWTPKTGSIILGRRAGMTKDKSFDKIEEWRLWPIHAVSGSNHAGQPFTSARILQPKVTSEITPASGTVKATGVIPADQLGQSGVLTGQIEFTRTFKIEPHGLHITTDVQSDGSDQVQELYETLPVFLRDAGLQPNATPTIIEIQVDGKWIAATDQWHAEVSNIKLTRFDGAVQITFDTPRRIKLGPSEWTDTWFTRAACRNILIDLLDKPDQVQPVPTTSVGYRISAIPK